MSTGQPSAQPVATLPPPPAAGAAVLAHPAAANGAAAPRPFMPPQAALGNGSMAPPNGRAALPPKFVGAQPATGPAAPGAGGPPLPFPRPVGPGPAHPQQQQQHHMPHPQGSHPTGTAPVMPPQGMLMPRPYIAPAASAAAAMPSSAPQAGGGGASNGLLPSSSAPQPSYAPLPTHMAGGMGMPPRSSPSPHPMPTSTAMAPAWATHGFPHGSIPLGPGGMPAFRPHLPGHAHGMLPPGMMSAAGMQAAFPRPPLPPGFQVVPVSGVGAAAGAAGAAAPAGPGLAQAPSSAQAPSDSVGASPAPGAASEGGSGIPAVSTSDIQMVQNLIERCLQLYMTQAEVVSILQSQAKIEPGFTQLVWQKLEEQNTEFFRCYYTRLKLKAQIIMFNHLLKQQVDMVEKLQRGWVHGPPGFAPVRPFGSTTASGIPLFQASGAAASGAADPMQQQQQNQQHQQADGAAAGLSAGGGDGGFGALNFGGLDGSGSPLFPHSESGHDLAEQAHSGGGGNALGGLLPRAASLHNPGAAVHGAGGGNAGGELGGIHRNFSLSDLALDHLHGGDTHMEDGDLGGFNLSDLSDLPPPPHAGGDPPPGGRAEAAAAGAEGSIGQAGSGAGADV